MDPNVPAPLSTPVDPAPVPGASMSTTLPISTPVNTPMPTLPWWRVGMVWLVVAGPALVMVAGVATFVIAVRGGDVPLRTSPPAVAAQGDMTPAAQARNHAAAPRR